jgi:hypothetical protein
VPGTPPHLPRKFADFWRPGVAETKGETVEISLISVAVGYFQQHDEFWRHTKKVIEDYFSFGGERWAAENYMVFLTAIVWPVKIIQYFYGKKTCWNFTPKTAEINSSHRKTLM